MAAIFISYVRESQEKAKSLADILVAIRHEVWFDQALTGGQPWWNRILSEIQKCDIFLFALDPESLGSTACKQEYDYAFKLGKTILPVMVADGVFLDRLPSALRQIQHVDYRVEGNNAFSALAKAVNAIPPSPPLPDPLPEPPAAPVSYLGSLREQVEASRILSLGEQTALALSLMQALREPKTADDVRGLLTQLRSRDDLLAKVADEIDFLLASSAASANRSPDDVPRRTSTPDRVRDKSDEASLTSTDPERPRTARRTLLANLSEVLSFKQVWISLVAGALISVILNLTKEYRWLPARLFSISSSWALPSITLLLITILWKRLESRKLNLKLALIAVPLVIGFAIPCYPRLALDRRFFTSYLTDSNGYYYYPPPFFPDFWAFDWEAGMAGAALSLLLAIGIFWNDDSVHPLPLKSAITSLCGGIACLFFVYLNRYWYYVVIQFLEYIFAIALVVCFLIIAAKKYTTLITRVSANE